MIEAQVEGGEKFLGMLGKLDKATRTSFRADAKAACDAGLEVVLSYIQSVVPRRLGKLASRIKIRVWKNPQRGEVAKKIDIATGSRGGPNDVHYGFIVNSGFTRKNGTYVAGKHFMENGYEFKGQEAQDVASGKLSVAIDQVIDNA